MKQRRMRRNHSTAGPTRVIVIHSRSVARRDPAKAGGSLRSLRLVCGRYCRIRKGRIVAEETVTFQRAEPLWCWVRSHLERRGLVWIVTPDARHDLTVSGLWRELDAGRFVLTTPGRPRSPAGRSEDTPAAAEGLFVFRSPPTILRLADTQGRSVIVVETANYGKATVREMADDHGIDLGEVPDAAGPIAPTRQYLERATLAIQAHFLGLADYVKVHNLGMFRWTAAGQAMAAYRHRWMTADIVTTEDDTTREIELQSYYAGWVQPFSFGRLPGRVWHLDVNGLYPWVMSRYEFPRKLVCAETRQEWRDGPPPIDRGRGIAEVEIETNSATYPVRYRGRLTMALGRFCTTLAGPELRRAIESGHVVRHARWISYATAPLFCRWAADLGTMRRDAAACGRKPQERYAKLLLNSLHGKFAQQTGGWELDPTMQTPVRWGLYYHSSMSTGQRQACLAVAGCGFRQVPRRPRAGTFPAVSAFIAAHARETIRWWIRTVGVEHVHYVGVDSLIVDWHGFDKIRGLDGLHDHELGKWKIKGVHDQATIIGSGTFILDGQRTVCGLKDVCWEDASGWTVQAASPDLESIFSRGPLVELPEDEYRRNVGAERAAVERDACRRSVPPVLDGWALRLYDGSPADWPICPGDRTVQSPPRPGTRQADLPLP